MSHRLIDLDARGFAHAKQVLTHYLPGLDLGLVALSDASALMPASTLKALDIEYGAAPTKAILSTAGITRHRAISSAQSIDLLRRRNVQGLPARAPQPPNSRLWHLDAVNVRPAWLALGGEAAIDWSGIKVGHIDTGYTHHRSLGFPGPGWIDTAAARNFFAAGQGPGGEGPGMGVSPLDAFYDGHGTRIASVICGYDPTATGGLYLGIAPKVPLVPVRIANDVFILHAQRELAQALRYLVHDVSVQVINLSMGFLPRVVDGNLERAIDETYEAGVILVCAAGQPLRQVVSPAFGRRSVAAAGSTMAGVPWGQSACGGAVDWAAPSVGISRAEPSRTDPSHYLDGGDGTSYAAAITTGAAALWHATHRPVLAHRYPHAWQLVEAFKAVAKATAHPMPHQQPGSFGAGILDIGALVQATLPAPRALTMEAAA